MIGVYIMKRKDFIHMRNEKNKVMERRNNDNWSVTSTRREQHENDSCSYEMIEERYEEGEQTRVSYGIAVCAESNGVVDTIRTVDDITSDRERLLCLVQDCNRLKLSPLHILDVVDDFLTQ